MAGLRQVLTSAGVIIPRRSSKSDLLALYNSLQSGELPNSSLPLKSATTASKSRKSPYSRPGPIFTPSRTGLRPPNRSGRPSASLGRAPDAAALSLHLPRASTERQLTTQPSEEPAFASTSRLTRTSTPPSAANSYTQPRINEPLPYPWPAAPPLTASPTPSAQAPAPAFPPPFFPPPLSVYQALSGSNLPQSLTQTPAIPPLFHAVRYLSTPVNIFRLSSELVHHPDPQFTKYLLPGLSHGFHPGVGNLPSESLICPNLQSALTEPETVDILIKKEIEANFMIGPFPVPPFNIFRVSPIGVATRKFSGKKRLIIDLSSPHNSPFPSINSFIPLEEFSLHYHDIDQAITLIKDAGRGAWLAKVDITSAFKVMPIHPSFWHLFGIRWNENFNFSVRLTFGCRSSPKIFDMLSEAICWILSNNYDIPYLVHLLDDFLIISPPDSIPAAHLLTTQKVFSELGIPLALDKTAGPSTSIEFLGINLDSQKFQASLPKEKIDRMILVASTLAAKPICSKRELLSVLGHLNFAMRIIPQGRPFISHLLTLASSTHALEDQIALTDSCCNELSLWISFFKRWNGLSFFYKNLISSPVDIQLFTDAAPSIGYGGFYQGRWFASTWPCQLSNLPQSAASSALFELYPIVIAAFLWGKEWSATSILIHCDNEATVHCVNKSRSHSPMLNPLLRRLTWISACDQFIITARHIPGSKNQIADSLSRFSFQKFRTLAPEADPLPTPVPPFSELIFP